MNEQLKPCPFCGGEARIIVVEKGVHSVIQCTTCYCGFMRHSFNNGDTDENAALRLTTAWNTRTSKKEEMRNGRWILPRKKGCVTYDEVAYKECSECGEVTFLAKTKYSQMNYCPNCGAKMDGGESK